MSLKIAQLGMKKIPSREGGIEIVVEQLATRMAERGHAVTCYNRSTHHVSGKDFDTGKIKEYRGVRNKYVPTLDKKGLAAVTSAFFATLCASFGSYDVVHIHAEGPAFMCYLPKLFGKKVIVTVHGLDHQRAKWGKFASAFIMMGEKNAVRFADEIIVLSPGVQEYFEKTYGRKTVLIPNGVNRPEIVEEKEICEKFGLEKDGYLLFLGRLVPEKGVRYLIESFRNINTSKKLVIAGGSSDSGGFVEELHTLAEGDDRILFTGFVQGRMLEELYSNAYLYILPSDLEGMPLSLLEAMSYGNACLTSDIGECAGVMEDHGLTFRKGDVNDLTEKLQQLCDDEETVIGYKKEASDYICSKYNWDDVTDRTLSLYESAGSGKKRKK
ncbi:MAG: glycosyltransferase family 4 protein [Lachnospiraceae bacterium]|nr:glycosyltransferase family 4 protein [Lachnospiraceae bacterium]